MKKTFFVIAALAAALSLSSCLKDDSQDNSKFYANALVTVKHTPEGEFYLQVDDKTTAKPGNLTKSPFGDKQVRALANITDKGEYVPAGEGSAAFDRLVEVNWIDSIRTKDLVQTLGSREEDEKEWGDAPIDVIANWVTILEDGYLTLAFSGLWGNPMERHMISLVSGTDPENPYYLELMHNPLNDRYDYGSAYEATGVIAFDLSSLPAPDADSKLTIHYKSLHFGEKTIYFDFPKPGDGKPAEASLQTSNAALRSIDRALKLD